MNGAWLLDPFTPKAPPVRNYKRRTRKNTLPQNMSRETIELRKQHIKNLSDTQLIPEQINLLSRGLKFIPTPVMKENQIRRQLFSDFSQFARSMRLQYIYHDQNTKQHPYQVKSSWIQPIQMSVALESHLEVKIKLCTHCSSVPLYLLFLCISCSSVPIVPLHPLFLCSSVPTVPLYPLFLCTCTSVPTVPLYHCTSVPSVPVYPLSVA